MRLTRRGWGALALVAVSLALGALFGQRSLNAVVAPTLVALLVAVALVWRADPPAVSHGPLEAGFPGQERTLRLDAEGSGVATIEQTFPEGVAAAPVDATVALPHAVERDIRLRDRGVYDLDPPTVRQRDPLGLLERAVAVDAGARLVVYPEVYALAAPARATLFGDDPVADRGEFDRLREYVPGDPLRDVHWKSTAKRDEFMVMEFAPTDRGGTVTVAADARPGHADAMAAAAATVAGAATDAGLDVELVLPGDHLPAGSGEHHREALLRALAATGAGRLPDAVRAEADVAVRAGPEGTIVRAGGRRHAFASLTTGPRHAADPPEREVAA